MVRLDKSPFPYSVRRRLPSRILVRDSELEFDEGHHFSVLIGVGQIGVGIAQAAAFLLQSETGLDAGAGLAAEREIKSF
jgi:hypothetical protein